MFEDVPLFRFGETDRIQYRNSRNLSERTKVSASFAGERKSSHLKSGTCVTRGGQQIVANKCNSNFHFPQTESALWSLKIQDTGFIEYKTVDHQNVKFSHSFLGSLQYGWRRRDCFVRATEFEINLTLEKLFQI